MKNQLFNLVGLLSGIITIVVFVTGKASIEELGGVYISSSFWYTFFKTPIVYVVIIATISFVFWTFIIDLIRYFLFGNSVLWDWTSVLWDWGWRKCTINWYWNESSGNHILVSIFIWSLILLIINYLTEND